MWLYFALGAYFLLAAGSVGDKFLLSTSFPHPISYAMTIGFMGLLIILAVPFLGFPTFAASAILPSLAAGFLFVAGLVPYFTGLKRYEASRIVPATGGMVPMFVFSIETWLLHGETLRLSILLPLTLLIGGAVAISWDTKKHVTLGSLGIAAITSFLFALSFVFLKYAYMQQPFWSGLFWKQIGGGSAALLLSVYSRLKHAPENRPPQFPRSSLYLINQGFGAGAGFLQNAAIYSAPLAKAAFVNAFEGIQYAFIFVLTYVLSSKYPNVFTDFRRRRPYQKIISITLIICGTAILAFFNS